VAERTLLKNWPGNTPSAGIYVEFPSPENRFSTFVAGCARQFNAMDTVDEKGWVIRTDFSSEDQWRAIRDLITAEQPQFPFVNFVSDVARRDQPVRDLVRSLPDDYPGMYCFVVDRDSVEKPEHPILVVGFYPADDKSFDRLPRDTPEAEISIFRAVPSQVWSIEANLSLANMDFAEFVSCVESDGVFRGHPPAEQRPTTER
jgi:hypothetical protein